MLLRDDAGANPVLFVATGVATTRCLAAAEALAERGASRVLHLPTVKPLDEAMLAEWRRRPGWW